MAYRGAGILFVCPPVGSAPMVLLGKRRYGRLDQGIWSVPGGGIESVDRGSFWNCARREVMEELRGSAWVEEAISRHLNKSRAAGNLVCSRLYIPRFATFMTYLIPVRAVPAGRLRFCDEFATMRWSPMDDLPRPLHLGVAHAMSVFGLRRPRPRP